MKSRFLKVCSMVIIVALLIQLLPLQVLALETNEEETPIISTEPVPQDNILDTEKITLNEPATILSENTSKRTEFSKEYRLSNGLNLAVVYPDAVHYQKDGQWEDIDTTLTVKNGVYTTAASPMNVSFPQQLSNSNAITVELNGYTVSFGMAGELRGSADGKITTSEMGRESAEMTVTQMQTSTAQLQTFDYSAEKTATEYPETVPETLKSRLVYSNVYSNTNVVYDLTGYKLKESVVIARYDSELQGYSYTLDTGKLIPVLNEDNSISLIDPATKEAVLNMPAPYMIDYDGEISNDVEVMLIPNGTTYTLMYRLPAQWLAAEDRSWPVVLDPVISATANISNIADATISENTTYSSGMSYLYIGVDSTNGIYRSYLRYKTLPTLQSGDVIVDASFRMKRSATSTSTSGIIEIHAVEESWSSSGITWANAPDASSSIEDFVTFDGSEWIGWNLTDLVQRWYKEGNYGMLIKAPDSVESGTTTQGYHFYSSDYESGAQSSVAPRLEMKFRNASGLEDYWDYTTTSARRAGTGYVNNYSGNLVWVNNDIGFDGNRMPVSINHIYNSNNKDQNLYGVGLGWKLNYHQQITPYGTGGQSYIWEDGDGTKHYFLKQSTGKYKDEDGLYLTLSVTSTGYTIEDKVGNKSIFDAEGRLIRIQNNQEIPSSINIVYQSSGSKLISYITDGVGRRYNLTYSNGVLHRISYVGTGATEIDYVRYGYGIDDSSELALINSAQQSTSFKYNENNLLIRCKNPDGYGINYTYTSSAPYRVVAIEENHVINMGTTTSGGNLTIQYGHNQTVITDHDGNKQIMQFNDWGNTVSIRDDKGRGQFFQYSEVLFNGTETPNQMKRASDLQTTVINLLRDNSFENGSTWSNVSSGSSVSSTVTTEEHYLGAKSLKLTATTAVGVRYTSGTISGSDTFTFSAYVKTNSIAKAHLMLTTSTGMSVKSETLNAGSDWTRLQVTITPTQSCTIYPQLMLENAGTVYMDCVQLERGTVASRFNIVDNGDFRYNDYNWARGSGLTSGDTFTTLSSPAPHMSASVYRMTGTPSTVKTITQYIPNSGATGDTYVLAGWAKGDSVPLNSARQFSLTLIFHRNGKTDISKTINFNPDKDSSGNWQYIAGVVTADDNYDSMTVKVAYSNNCNTVYFDGIQLYRGQSSEEYLYYANGNLRKVIDAKGNATEYSYNNSNDVIQIIYPGGSKIEYTYNYHNVTQAKQSYTDEEGEPIVVSIDQYGYDDYGNQLWHTSYTDGEALKTYASYTTNGNYLESTKDEFGNTTTYHYNPDTGLLEWVKYPKDTDSTRTNYTYDAGNRLSGTSVTTNQGKTLSAAYTYSGDSIASITTGSTAYQFTYNVFKDRTSVKIGTRTLVNYTYTDSQNRYLGQLDYGNGDRVQYTYDSEGRVTKATYEDGHVLSYVYSFAGDLVSVTDSATGNKIQYYYDDLGRVSELKQSNNTDTYQTKYKYDSLGSLSEITDKYGFKTYWTKYTYDPARRIQAIDTVSTDEFYAYDAHGRLSQWYTCYGSSVVMRKSIGYEKPGEYTTSNRPTAWNYYAVASDGYSGNYNYTYDANGNIRTVTVNGKTTTYTYDSANQLIREDNQASGWSWVWTYDNAGNILSKKSYAYTAGTLGTVVSTVNYVYGNTEWGDLLTTYNGKTITYDTIGNPLSDGTWSYTWQHGRQLASMSKSGTIWNFTYDANGMRTKRTNGTTTYTYFYNGSQLAHMTIGDKVLHFYYDANGYPLSVVYNDITYYYATNLQGDVVAIINTSGKQMVGYTYDAWGRLLSTTGSMSSTLGTYNPLRYRGYVYDSETQLYYLQSRYYNPTMGRFINADSLVDISGGLTSYNQFAYCGNNPVICMDPSGHWLETVFDLFSLGMSIVDVVINPLDPWAWAGLAGDALDLIPFVTGVGEGVKGMRVVAKGADLADDALTTIRFAKAASYADEFAEGGLDLAKLLDKTSDGFTISNRLDGIRIHKSFMGNGMKIPNSRLRVDGLDKIAGCLYELKPYNRNSLRKGFKQILNYNDSLGGAYQMVLVFY